MSATVVPILEAPDYERQIQLGTQALRDGKVVVLPTETVYGAAGVLDRAETRERLRTLRNASESKPFVPHLVRREQAQAFLGPINPFARRLMLKLWPGPVGLQFPVAPDRQREVAAKFSVEISDLYEDGLITLRFPDHPVFHDVVSALDQPVVATLASSSNVRTASELAGELTDKVDLVYDAGLSRFSKPSTLIKVETDSYKVVRVGVYDERIIERLLKTTLLFVCSGNTCRSPMGEALARRLLSDRLKVPENELGQKGYEVFSAGAYAMPGSRATPEAVEAVSAVGADLSRHRSRILSVELIHQADRIFAMSKGHARAVTALVPSAADKTTTLDPKGDIEDPIGGDASLYNELAKQMESLIAIQVDAMLATGSV